VAIGLKIAICPTVKTLDGFDLKFQPSVDQHWAASSLRRASSPKSKPSDLRRAPRRQNASRDRPRARRRRGRRLRRLPQRMALLAALFKAETDGGDRQPSVRAVVVQM
jgi:hypothetical protein